MKILFVTELQTLLDNDHAWRIKELSEIKSVATLSVETRQKMMIRAGIALAYAHWEGFVKNAAHWYLVHINSQRHTYSQLKSQFGVFGFKSQLNNLANSKKHKLNTEALEFIVSHLSTRAYMSLSNAVDTESNLNSLVFENIAYSIDIDTTTYSLRYNFIDEVLLKRRNEIAHGEHANVDLESLKETIESVMTLMRNFKDDISNHAVNKKYLR